MNKKQFFSWAFVLTLFSISCGLIGSNQEAEPSAQATLSPAQLPTEVVATQEIQVVTDVNCNDIFGNIRKGDYSNLVPGVSLDGCEFNRIDLLDLNLENASFKNAYLHLVNFTGTNLQRADFSRSTLYQSNLSDTNLAGAAFNGALLIDSVFDGADLSETDLLDALFGFEEILVPNRIENVSWSKDGTTLVVYDGYDTVITFDIKSGKKQITAYPRTNKYRHATALSPDGSTLIELRGNGTERELSLWSTENADYLSTIAFPDEYAFNASILKWHPNGRQVLAVGSKHNALIDVQSGEIVNDYISNNNWTIWDMEWSSDGNKIAVSTAIDPQLWIYDTVEKTLKMIREKDDGLAYSHLVWSHDNSLLGTIHADRLLEIISIETGQGVMELTPPYKFNGIGWLDNTHFITVPEGDNMQLYQIDSTEPVFSSALPDFKFNNDILLINPLQSHVTLLSETAERVFIIPISYLFPNQ